MMRGMVLAGCGDAPAMADPNGWWHGGRKGNRRFRGLSLRKEEKPDNGLAGLSSGPPVGERRQHIGEGDGD